MRSQRQNSRLVSSTGHVDCQHVLGPRRKYRHQLHCTVPGVGGDRRGIKHGGSSLPVGRPERAARIPWRRRLPGDRVEPDHGHGSRGGVKVWPTRWCHQSGCYHRLPG